MRLKSMFIGAAVLPIFISTVGLGGVAPAQAKGQKMGCSFVKAHQKEIKGAIGIKMNKKEVEALFCSTNARGEPALLVPYDTLWNRPSQRLAGRVRFEEFILAKLKQDGRGATGRDKVEYPIGYNQFNLGPRPIISGYALKQLGTLLITDPKAYPVENTRVRAPVDEAFPSARSALRVGESPVGPYRAILVNGLRYVRIS